MRLPVEQRSAREEASSLARSCLSRQEHGRGEASKEQICRRSRRSRARLISFECDAMRCDGADNQTNSMSKPAPQPAAAAAAASSSSAAVAASDPRPTQPTQEPSAQSVSYHISPGGSDAEGNAVPEGVLGCAHYARKCLIRAPCCTTFFPCRLCHADVARPPKLDHEIDRKAIDEMVCMICLKAGRGAGVQPVAAACQDCKAPMARYYCGVCHLFDDDASHSIFHCDGCGICRRGLREEFKHCTTCSCCMTISAFADHKCVEDATKRDCAICLSDMFSGRDPISFLRCGHPLHVACMRQLFSSARDRMPVCPLCKMSCVEQDAAMQSLIDSHVESTPMPEEYREWSCLILCNDCLTKSEGVPWRPDYTKCPREECGSYNTDVLERYRSKEEAEAARAAKPLSRGPSQVGAGAGAGVASSASSAAAASSSVAAASAAAPAAAPSSAAPSSSAAAPAPAAAPSSAANASNADPNTQF